MDTVATTSSEKTAFTKEFRERLNILYCMAADHAKQQTDPRRKTQWEDTADALLWIPQAWMFSRGPRKRPHRWWMWFGRETPDFAHLNYIETYDR
jgi:hypothetical protein